MVSDLLEKTNIAVSRSRWVSIDRIILLFRPGDTFIAHIFFKSSLMTFVMLYLTGFIICRNVDQPVVSALWAYSMGFKTRQ